jgi:hypothetical protein
MTITLSLKNVDVELVQRAKVAALTRGITLKEFIVEAIDEAVPEKIDDILLKTHKARTRAAERGSGR